jgi:hypothetical protein
MIREYNKLDERTLRDIHLRSGLPPNCWPNLDNPLYIVRLVDVEGNRVVQGGFIKLTGEAYILLDHDYDTPERRWQILQSLTVKSLFEAGQPKFGSLALSNGLEDVSAWLPPSLVKSFWPRLKTLGFEPSPWQSYTAALK